MFCTCDSLNPASSHPFTACFLKVASLVSNYLGWALLPPAGHSGTSPPCLISGAGSNSGFLGLRTLYLQGEGRLDFAAWNTAIGGAAGGGGTGLQEQQMSRGDIPIIVDACISFVTQHGLRLEGVYRKGGARARSLRLLAEFRRDARSVKLRPREHFVEDVTDTLKRFFRELDDPVTSARLLPRWREAAGTSKTHPRSHLPLSVPTKFSCGTGQSLSQHSPSWWSPRN